MTNPVDALLQQTNRDVAAQLLQIDRRNRLLYIKPDRGSCPSMPRRRTVSSCRFPRRAVVSHSTTPRAYRDDGRAGAYRRHRDPDPRSARPPAAAESAPRKGSRVYRGGRA